MTPSSNATAPSIAETLATFVADLTPQQIPAAVLKRARHLLVRTL